MPYKLYSHNENITVNTTVDLYVLKSHILHMFRSEVSDFTKRILAKSQIYYRFKIYKRDFSF